MARLINIRKIVCKFCNFDTMHTINDDKLSTCLRCDGIHEYKIEELLEFDDKEEGEYLDLHSQIGEMPE